MSDKVVRWRLVSELDATENRNGDWVRYSDYAALAAEVENLRRALESSEYNLNECRKGSVIRTRIDRSRYQTITRLREALVFYADTQSYEGGNANCVTGEEPVLKDGGKTARRALEVKP